MRNRWIWATTLILLGTGSTIGTMAVPSATLAESPTPTSAPGPATGIPINLEIGRSADVEVLVVGAQPTQKLRLKPKVGTQQTLNLQWNWLTGLSMDDRKVLSMQLPTIAATITATITKIDDNGDIHYQTDYRRMDVRPSSNSSPASQKAAAALQTQMQNIVGMKGTYIITDQGKPKFANLTSPKTTSPTQKAILQQFSQSLANLSAPLPEQGLGIGGKWRQQVPITLNGASITQTTTYELVSLKDGQATIDLTINQTANNQKITLPLKGAGDVNLASLQSEGKGQVVLQLDQLLPVRSSLSVDSNMVMQQAARDNSIGRTFATQNQIQLEMTSRND